MNLGTDEFPFYTEADDIFDSPLVVTNVNTMRRLLNELVQLRQQRTELQARGTALVEENRDLKRRLNVT